MQTVEAGGLAIGDEAPPRIMGVLNVSEKSPYDPSVFADPDDAARYVEESLIAEGADIVDVGLESANKRFEVLGAEAELDRLETALEIIDRVDGEAVWSIETRYASVADAALAGGFDMVNDICGFADPEMPAVCRDHDAVVVKMASPPDLERPGAVEETPWRDRKGIEWAETADYVDMVYEALKQNGLPDNAIVDPAFGGWSEAKTLEDDQETFRRLREFRGLGQPILVSINRKNFLKEIAGRSTDEALPVSLAATSMAVERGAHVVRTHDVAETRDAALIGAAFAAERVRYEDDEIRVEELDVRSPGELRRHLERIDAVGGAAGAIAGRIFEIDGLSDSEWKAVAAAVDGSGASVVEGRETILLAGPQHALDSVGRSISGHSGALDALRGCIFADRS